MRRKKTRPRPSVPELEAELRRVKYRRRYGSVLRSTVYALITVAAIAVLVATLWLPVLQIYGSSMTPTLSDGQIVFSIKNQELEHGDIVAFYYNNKILIKRVIAKSGEWVNMDRDGNVYINNILLEEPYLTDKAYGDSDLEYPYQVPDGMIFVMGDHRSTSADSRHTAVGCIGGDQIVGKILFRVWPMEQFGPIS